MFDTIYGLPVHALIVHATVVLVPTACLLVALAAVYPRFRAWAGPLPAATAIVAMVLTPLSTKSGEALRHRLGSSPLIDAHKHLAETLKFWVLPLALVACLAYWLHRRGEARKALTTGVAVIAVLLSVGTLVDVARIGHSGAKASWEQRIALTNPKGTSG